MSKRARESRLLEAYREIQRLRGALAQCAGTAVADSACQVTAVDAVKKSHALFPEVG
jgi:hypothetical protein